MQEEIVHTSIYHPEVGIKAQSSPITGPARQWVEETIQALKREGAEVIILGCTEFPLAITEPVLFGIPIIDPTTILARALIREVAPGKLKPLVIPEAG
jgi:aspartate racemase